MLNPTLTKKTSTFQWLLHLGVAVSIFAFSGFAAEQPSRIQNKIQTECPARKASTQKRVSLFRLRTPAKNISFDCCLRQTVLGQLIHFENQIRLQLNINKDQPVSLCGLPKILKINYAPRSAVDLALTSPRG